MAGLPGKLLDEAQAILPRAVPLFPADRRAPFPRRRAPGLVHLRHARRPPPGAPPGPRPLHPLSLLPLLPLPPSPPSPLLSSPSPRPPQPPLPGVVSGHNGTHDPARARFDLQMSEISSRIEYLERQKVQEQEKLDELAESIDLTPANAIALGALERDYANIQNQYNQSVDSLAKASTGERIETLSRGQRISVVEQPTAPSEPTKPNRPLIAGGGTAFGIMAGLGLIVLLEVLNTTVRRPVDLVKSLGVTPIATIPYLRTRQQNIRRRMSQLAVILIVAALVPASIYALHTYYTVTSPPLPLPTSPPG